MGSIDAAILLWINQYAHSSFLLDASVVELSEASLLKGGVIMCLFWWVWAPETDGADTRRERLLVNLLTCLFVVAMARGLVHILPFRERPLSAGIPGFHIAYTLSVDSLNRWSSFPSDHASLFFSLATGIWMVSKRLGLFAYIYSTLVICLPRVYLGMHYPSDILAGALLGIGIAVLVEKTAGQHWRGRWLNFWWSRNRPLLYTLLFLLSYQIATLFSDIRTLGGFAARVLLGEM